MSRRAIILALGVAQFLAFNHRGARAETLAQLIFGASLETSLFKFDVFSYAPYTGGPDAAAINVLPISKADGSEGLRFAGTFSSTSFNQASIRYRVTAKADALIGAAALTGNPTSGPSGFTFVDAVFSGGLSPLSIWSQGSVASTSDATDFAMPRNSFTVNSLLRLSGSPNSPSTLSQFEETFRAATAGADFDGDGDVDGADFLLWQRGLRPTGGSQSVGDANGDGSVDGADLAIWRNQFGPRGTLVGAIPEPDAVLMAWAAATGILLGSRRTMV